MSGCQWHHPHSPPSYVVDDDDAVLGSLFAFLLENRWLLRADVPRTPRRCSNATSPPGADCYVIDYKMPDINGIEWPVACANRRRYARDPDHRLSRWEHLCREQRQGVEDVILKPLLDESLEKCIRGRHPEQAGD